jgi:hypothetical protein
MSGADIPYQLRPNKFIDRQMFLDALSRLIIPRGPEQYVYVSMGGNHLVDHYEIYNSLGIQSQFSFDRDENAVERQKFNRPTDATVCVFMDSSDLPAKVDEIMEIFPRKTNLIVWLDYTDSQRGKQFQEVVQTLVRMKHGDVFRVTINAAELKCENFKAQNYATPAAMRAAKLREQIGNFMPTDVTAIIEGEFHSVLTRSLELVTREAERLKPGIRIRPVLITTYKDGARMLTVTCAVSDEGSKNFPSKEFARWKFASKNWENIQTIFAPLLSPREQHRLDSRIKQGPAHMMTALPFAVGADPAKSREALRSYRDFHRYYPTFRHVDD